MNILTSPLHSDITKIPLWYPMRVTYGREMAVKERLDADKIENFLPMLREDYVDDNKKARHRLAPAVNNLIFIHAPRSVITEKKMFDKAYSALRYMIDQTKETDTIMTVPDRQMENFMKVAAKPDDRISYLRYNQEFLGKPGQRVRIKCGDFKDVEGIIKRIRKRKQVVVEIKGIIAATIDFVPTSWLEMITE